VSESGDIESLIEDILFVSKVKSPYVMIPATINGIPLNCVIDSGSSGTILNSKFVQPCKLKCVDRPHFARGLDGVRVHIRGRAQAQIDLSPTIRIPTLCWIMDKVSNFDLILGNDILRRYVKTLDYERNTLNLKCGTELKLYDDKEMFFARENFKSQPMIIRSTSDTSPTFRALFNGERTTLKPFESLGIQILIVEEKGTDSEGWPFEFEITNGSQQDDLLHLRINAQTVKRYDWSNPEGAYIFVTTGDQPVTLHPGNLLGFLEEKYDGEIEVNLLPGIPALMDVPLHEHETPFPPIAPFPQIPSANPPTPEDYPTFKAFYCGEAFRLTSDTTRYLKAMVVTEEISNPNHWPLEFKMRGGQQEDSLDELVVYTQDVQRNDSRNPQTINVLVSTEDASVHIRRGSFLGYLIRKKLPELQVNTLTINPESPKERINPEIPETDRDKIKQLLEEYDIIIAKPGQCLISSKLVADEIELLPGAKPVRCKPYYYSAAERELIDDYLEEQLALGYIVPSRSDWSSPLIIVKSGHSDGRPRICCDFRQLNAVTRRIMYPLPNIQMLLDTLQGQQFYTTIDLKLGFNQVQLTPNSQRLSSFVTHRGLYAPLALTFGLTNGPAIFQSVLDRVLNGLIPQVALVYLDDIVIYSKDISTHLKNLRIVFERLKEFELKISLEKSHFCKTEILILGHIISSSGISTNPAKIACVRDFPPCRNQTEVRQIIGLASYYRRFVKGFSARAKPLTRLLENNVPFLWTESEQKALDDLKNALCTAPVLRHWDPQLPAEVHVDASDFALGSVLVQLEMKKEHVIAYASRALNPSERNYSTIQKEFLGLLFALEKFRHFLYGIQFVVKTDHNPLLCLKHGTSLKSAMMQRWAVRISEYDFTIQHKSGRLHSDADALSRMTRPDPAPDLIFRDEEATTSAAVSRQDDDFLKFPIFKAEVPDLITAQQDDPFCSLILQRIHNQESVKNMELTNGLLFYTKPKPRLVVPSIRQTWILNSLHNSSTSGHRAFETTYGLISLHYYWPKMKQMIKEYTRRCLICQQAKRPYRAPVGLLAPLPIPDVPHSAISIDYAGPLKETARGNKHYILCTCLLTRHVTAKATPDQTAETTAHFLLHEIILKYGPPLTILSDRGSAFMSDLVRNLLSGLNIKSVYTSGYHPQTNGMTERGNSTFKGTLRTLLKNDEHDEWDLFVPHIAWSMNTSVNTTTRQTPFFLVFGRPAIQPVDRGLPLLHEKNRMKEIDRIQKARKLVHDTIRKEQNRYKKRYDQGRKELIFAEGEMVMLKNLATKKGLTPKLVRRWEGPYYIIRQVSPLLYEIQQGNCGKSFIANVNRMKTYYAPYHSDESEEELDAEVQKLSWLENLRQASETLENTNRWNHVLESVKSTTRLKPLQSNSNLTLNFGNDLKVFLLPIALQKEDSKLLQHILVLETTCIVLVGFQPEQFLRKGKELTAFHLGDTYQLKILEEGTDGPIYTSGGLIQQLKAPPLKSNSALEKEIKIIHLAIFEPDGNLKDLKESINELTSALHHIHATLPRDKGNLLIASNVPSLAGILAVTYSHVHDLSRVIPRLNQVQSTFGQLGSKIPSLFRSEDTLRLICFSLLKYFRFHIKAPENTFKDLTPEMFIPPIEEEFEEETIPNRVPHTPHAHSPTLFEPQNPDPEVAIPTAPPLELLEEELQMENSFQDETDFPEIRSHAESLGEPENTPSPSVSPLASPLPNLSSATEEESQPSTAGESSEDSSESDENNVPITTRAGRTVKPPAYLQDYEL